MDLEWIKENAPRAILKYAVPSIIAMILTSSITIVDGLFIGNYIGKEAIAAVNLGLPILYLFLAVGIMFGVGGNAIATRLLGSRKNEESIAVFNQTIFTTIVTLIILSLIFLLILDNIAELFIKDVLVRDFFYKYYFIMLFAYPLMVLNTNFGMFIRSEGRPEVFMLFTVITIAVNVILDYVFIAVTGSGIKGIAYASVISIITGFLFMLIYFKLKSRVFKFSKLSLSKDVLANSVFNGSSELIGQLSMSITMFALNYVILKEVGVSGVAAFTIVGYVSYIFSMIVIGFGQGASPIISYSFGAGEYELSKRVRKITILYVLVFGLATVALLNLLSDGYSSMFVKNITVQDLVGAGIPIYSIAFLFMGFNVITSFYFTSIGAAKESAAISASRGLVILLICIFIFPALWGMTGVWLVAPVTELLTVILSLVFILKDNRLHRI
ncbi:MAG: MATE family efflux transporter [Spirochaetales bacterium]|nr:MATE family efflux transporter [Spirochaetales bacterium]